MLVGYCGGLSCRMEDMPVSADTAKCCRIEKEWHMVVIAKIKCSQKMADCWSNMKGINVIMCQEVNGREHDVWLLLAHSHFLIWVNSTLCYMHEQLTLMLLLANLVSTKWCKITEKMTEIRYMGAHLKVLRENYPMITNMIGFRWFSK